MTTMPANLPPIGPAWEKYISREHAARDAYLFTVQSAYREYLTGPWPDRSAYEAVERSAWMTYYAVGRDAWRTYTQEIAATPPVSPLPAPIYLGRDAGGEVWPGDARYYSQPVFTPTEEGNR